MKDIYCVFTPYNAWGNKQVSGKPHMMSFDINNVKYWTPFFGDQFEYPLNGMASIQEDVTFTTTSLAQCLEVEKTFRDAIKSSLRKWRSKRTKAVTTFHPDACDIMTDMLIKLEQWKLTGDK